MIEEKKPPELSNHITIRTTGMFSTFHLLNFMGRWGAWIVLLASFLITFNAWYFISEEATKRAQTRFDFQIKAIETRIYERLQTYEFLLRGGSALFATSDEVTREDWQTYVTKLQINQYYPGIQGVGFSKHILPFEKEAHLRQIRGKGFPQYTIKPEGNRPEYTSIIFLEPFDWRNQRAFGYDMFSDPTRKEAMIRARDTGLASLSGKVTLVQETIQDVQAGFLIYLAVYRKGEPLETLEQRNKALMGYVYSPFRMNEFMKGILVEKVGYVNLQIFDGEKPLTKNLLYRSENTEETHNAPEGRHFATNQSILHYAGHRWLLSFVSSKYFEENIETESKNFIVLLGITISLLLFGIVLSLTRSRSQAITLANTTLNLEKANIELRKEISERNRSEKALKRSEALQSKMVANIGDVIVIIDQGGINRYKSPNSEKLFGWKPEEVVGNSAWDNVHPEDLESTQKFFVTLMHEPNTSGTTECRYKCKDDSYRWIEFTGNNLLHDPDIRGILGNYHDVTERKQIEEALRENEQRYKKAQRMGRVGNWEYNLATEKFWGSDEVKKIYGFDPQSKSFTTNEVENCIPERERVHQALMDLIEKNKPYNLEFEIHPITGPHSKIIKSVAEIANDDSGRPHKILGVVQDITDRKKADKEKQALEAQLQQAQKIESIGTLAGGIAHDFNNILFPIIGHTELLIEDLPDDSPMGDSLKEIYTATLRASDLVKQILTFARQDNITLKLIKMEPVINEALKLIRATIPTTIDIRHDIENDCGIIKADPSHIHQIIMNLATNAYHAMQDKGGELTVNLKEIVLGEHDAVKLGIKPGSYACLTVADTGVGMDKSILDKAFDPFFTTKEQGKGTGMGLSVVHGIIKNAGGSINAYSEIGKGSQFNVYLPVVKNSFEQHELQTKELIQGGTEQILLVDDEKSILKMEKQMLERLGYQIVSCSSSLEALEIFRATPDKFDLVITDMTMPNMSGDKLSGELIKLRPDISILLCTGFSERIPKQNALSLGIKGFLMKPIMKADLSKKIREVLDA